jgi:hypothetical protein
MRPELEANIHLHGVHVMNFGLIPPVSPVSVNELVPN